MLVVLVVLVVLALEDRLEVATRVLEDVLEVKLSVSTRSAMVSELSIVLAPAPTSDPSKTSSNIADIGKGDNPSERRKGNRNDRDRKSDVNGIDGKRRHDQQPLAHLHCIPSLGRFGNYTNSPRGIKDKGRLSTDRD